MLQIEELKVEVDDKEILKNVNYGIPDEIKQSIVNRLSL